MALFIANCWTGTGADPPCYTSKSKCEIQFLRRGGKRFCKEEICGCYSRNGIQVWKYWPQYRGSSVRNSKWKGIRADFPGTNCPAAQYDSHHFYKERRNCQPFWRRMVNRERLFEF